MSRVTVVGAGVAGLTAARDLALAGVEVLVREAGAQVGGKLRTSRLAGVELDEGAESFLARLPEATGLAGELGLALAHPVGASPALVIGGRLVALPAGTLMGMPSSARGMLPVLGAWGMVRAAADLVLPASRWDGEPTVGALVRRRVGSRVLDRLVEPLLGGVYAGRADELGVAAVLPALAEPGRSLILTARRVMPRGGAPTGPVFGTVGGGMALLARALAGTAGVEVRTGRPVRQLERQAAGWRVDGEPADAVVLAVPGPAAARLLAGLVDGPHLPAVPYASVAVVSLALSEPPPVGGSGFLVPPGERRMLKAVTLYSQKWGLPPEPALVRASVGRFGAERDLQRSDDELVGVAAAEISEITGWRGRVLHSRVTRWGGALPQYGPGHGQRVAGLRAALPAGFALAGAAYDGVGVPACIRSGHRAAAAVLGALSGS